MAFDRADIYVRSTREGEFWQGEIVSSVVEYRWISPTDEVNAVEHELAIILSPDCDLTQDHTLRAESASPPPHKLLHNVLLCEVAQADALRGANAIQGKLWPLVKDNKSERYHYLATVPPERDLEAVGFSPLALDFRQYFCVATAHLKSQIESASARRRCRLSYPFGQHLAQRFFYYQSRIGLPADHDPPASQSQPQIPALLPPDN